MPAQSRIRYGILLCLDAHNGEIQGTENLALELNAIESKKDFIKYARQLEAQGLISITRSCGGRGHRTIYKRNRNQPGQPRRTHHA